jgi:PKD repeat protein
MTRFASVFLTVAVAVMILFTNCGDDDPVNNAPNACFVVTPESGTTDTTFRFDASCCSDAEDPVTSLEVRWDWENDETWDTGWATTKTASHQYSTSGIKTIALEVKDKGGLTDRVTRQVEVVPALYCGCDYFPLSAGNHWEYNTGTADVEGSEHTFVDGIGLRVDWDLVFESDTSVSFWNCIDGALAFMGKYDQDGLVYVNDPFVGLASILANSMYVGAQWTLFGEEGTGVDSLRIEVLGTESVTVPAGTFDDCLKIQATIFDNDPAVTYTDEAYFAEGVGLVKEERISQSGPTDGVFLLVNEDYRLAELQSASVDGVDYP